MAAYCSALSARSWLLSDWHITPLPIERYRAMRYFSSSIIVFCLVMLLSFS